MSLQVFSSCSCQGDLHIRVDKASLGSTSAYSNRGSHGLFDVSVTCHQATSKNKSACMYLCMCMSTTHEALFT